MAPKVSLLSEHFEVTRFEKKYSFESSFSMWRMLFISTEPHLVPSIPRYLCWPGDWAKCPLDSVRSNARLSIDAHIACLQSNIYTCVIHTNGGHDLTAVLLL